MIPHSSVRWHYSVVANGLAVTVPGSELHRLSEIPGATVWPSVTYHEQLDRTPKLIGAPTIWGPTLATAGNGIKIGIIDDGVDQTHVFFDPANFSYPAGFPKGQTTYTTPKVIVARAFAPASTHWKYADTPFDPAALRITVGRGPSGATFAADLRVLPLIDGTDYRDLQGWTGEARVQIAPLGSGSVLITRHRMPARLDYEPTVASYRTAWPRALSRLAAYLTAVGDRVACGSG